MLMGVQMKNQKLTCPNCGHKYPALFIRARSVCPDCHSEAHTDLRTVGIVETVIGLPLLWLLAVLLRTVLHDETGVLSYALLIIPALVIHLLIVQRFVKAQVVNASRREDKQGATN
jgi:uncharacterized protein (DUF983 family)